MSRLKRWPQNEENFKNEDDFKNEDNLKNEAVLKNEDNLKKEDNIKNEADLKIEDNLKNWPIPQKHPPPSPPIKKLPDFFFDDFSPWQPLHNWCLTGYDNRRLHRKWNSTW